MKNIYLEPEEEIISIVDRLSQAETDQVHIVVPPGAQIWQSSINLKLLKREADGMGKQVTLVVSDDLGAEMAERVGFSVKKEEDFPTAELAQARPAVAGKKKKTDKDDMIGILVKEMNSEKKPAYSVNSQKKTSLGFSGFRSKKTSELKNSKQGMSDIVNPKKDIKINFFRRNPLKKSVSIEKSPKLPPIQKKPVEPEPVISEPISKKDLTPSRQIDSLTVSSSGGFKWSRILFVFIALAFVVSAAVGYVVLPSAEVIIYPKTEEVSFDLSIIGSKDISQLDEGLNRIPLQEIEVQKTKSKKFTSTGEEEVTEKARGFILIYNEFSSVPQTLVATTRFESPDGKIFRIMENVIVPGAKIEQGRIVANGIEVEVIADQPGADYNINSTNFTIPGFEGTPKFAGFYGQSQSPMSGGYTGIAQIVSNEDLENAENELSEELKNEIRQALEEQIPEDLKVLDQGLKEDIVIISDIESGTVMDQFTFEIKATVRALIYKEDDLKSLIDLNLVSNISDDKKPLSQTQRIDWTSVSIDWDTGEASLDLSVQEDAAWQIDIPSLKQDLAGKKEVEVRKYLASQPEIEQARVTFWPFWVNKIPKQDKKIKVQIIEE